MTDLQIIILNEIIQWIFIVYAIILFNIVKKLNKDVVDSFEDITNKCKEILKDIEE